jgi:hypothetical protein
MVLAIHLRRAIDTSIQRVVFLAVEGVSTSRGRKTSSIRRGLRSTLSSLCRRHFEELECGVKHCRGLQVLRFMATDWKEAAGIVPPVTDELAVAPIAEMERREYNS